jgi:hypothetical protein
MGNLGEIYTTIGADITDLSRAEKATKSFVGTFTSEMNKTSGPVGLFESNIKGVTSSFISMKSAAMGVFAALGAYKLARHIQEVTHMSGKYMELGIAMKAAGANAGYSGQQMGEFEEGLHRTGIAMIESRQILTKMATANMDLANATKLARAAQDLAVVGGLNSSETFERMTYAIQSAQVEMLRTIGMNVTFERAYKTMAEQLGKNTKELTEQEKTQARMNIVLEEAAKFQGIYEGAMTSAEKQMRSMTRYIDNYKVKFGDAFQPAYLKIVETKTKCGSLLLRLCQITIFNHL